MKFYLNLQLKQLLKILFFVLILFLLLMLSKENFSSISTSTSIFLTKVFPSLFSFILFAEFVINSDILYIISQTFGNIISKIFKVSKNSSTAIIIGFLCGFPMGAKTVSKLYDEKQISKSEAYKLLMLVNNCNPAFILSTVGIGIFNNLSIGILLLISHYISSIFTYIILSKFNIHLIIHDKTNFSNSFKENNINEFKTNTNIDNFYILKKSILNSFITLSNIFAFIILFNLLSNNIDIFLKNINLPNNLRYIVSGFFEVTNGCNNIYLSNFDIYQKIYIISFLLGFTGFSIIFQIYSVIYSNKFKLQIITISKTLHGIISFLITYALIRFTNILNISTINVYSKHENYISYDVVISNMKKSYIISTLIILVFLLILYLKKRESSLRNKS